MKMYQTFIKLVPKWSNVVLVVNVYQILSVVNIQKLCKIYKKCKKKETKISLQTEAVKEKFLIGEKS